MTNVIDLVKALRATLLQDLPNRWDRQADEHDQAALELIEENESPEEVGLHLETSRVLRLCAQQLRIVMDKDQ